MCKNCRAQDHELWAIGPPYPKWEKVHPENFIELVKCPECGQLWVEAYYEPFASFRYSVKWPGDESLFIKVCKKDNGKLLDDWHFAQIRSMSNNADETTLDYIQAHYRRSKGYVDLTPSDKPNTIDLYGT